MDLLPGPSQPNVPVSSNFNYTPYYNYSIGHLFSCSIGMHNEFIMPRNTSFWRCSWKRYSLQQKDSGDDTGIESSCTDLVLYSPDNQLGSTTDTNGIENSTNERFKGTYHVKKILAKL